MYNVLCSSIWMKYNPSLLSQWTTEASNNRADFAAAAGVAGVELLPPQSAPEWSQNDQVLLRTGHI